MATIQLLVRAPEAPNEPAADTRFGGAPATADGFDWPACATCGGDMSFLGQVRRTDADRLLLVFMCENDPGMCDVWDADEGGNAVVAVAPTALRQAAAQPDGAVVRPRHGARVELVEAENYGAARESWGERPLGRRRDVLGQVGGEPDWLQADETPACDGCGKPMVFAAQLEPGPDHATEMNFGGGCAYLFDCGCPAGAPKFLWQC